MIAVLAGLTFSALLLAAYTIRACLSMVAADRAGLTAAFAAERVQHAEQIAVLLQRIQAPEQAVVDHSVGLHEEAPAPPVPMDDDDAQWAARGIEVSRETLAEHAYMAELA